VLLSGLNHVALLTNDTDRLVSFYDEVFGAPAEPVEQQDGFRMTVIHLGDAAELNVFQIEGNDEADRQVPMFGRGRLDHLALQAASLESFSTIRDRLVERGASDGFVTDFGPLLSVFFRDPDGLEAEVCVGNPDGRPGQFNAPGTPARQFHPDGEGPPG
jgi:catechol 2,3-dioxygenase-like lactoylglutathione lyase family enzyme